MPSPDGDGLAGDRSSGRGADADRVAGFRHVGDDVRFEGWRISLVDGTFEAPDGTTYHRDIVRHPGAVAVVPLTDRGSVLLVRQYRGPIDRWLLEIPAGTRDVEGEAPEVTAGRELEEEVGVRAAHIERLATIWNSPGFCDEETVLYLARDLTPVGHDRHGHEEEHIEVVEVELDRVPSMVANGELTDAQTVLGLLMARDHIAGPPRPGDRG